MEKSNDPLDVPRANFQTLKDRSASTKYIYPTYLDETDRHLKLIEDGLKAKGRSYEALDENGKKTAEVMRQELKEAARGSYIQEARSAFKLLQGNQSKNKGAIYSDDIKSGIEDSVTLIAQIQDKLGKAGADYSKLDRAGEKSDRFMRAAVDALASEGRKLGDGIPRLPNNAKTSVAAVGR